jgi:transcriptional antiterminator Rof (Rho-off)
MNQDYQPIACSVYDVLEVAAMRKQRLILKTATGERDVVVHDVYAKGKEEFLDAVDPTKGERFTLRLDLIQEILDPVEKKVLFFPSVPI